VDVVRSKTPPLNLSKATKLEDLSLWCEGYVRWVTMALQTVQSENLQRIIIRPSTTTGYGIGEAAHREWWDLDRLLVQFWVSRPTRPKIMYMAGKRENGFGDLARRLLPELTQRGALDLVEE
jgi:hypothetical protein